MFNEMSREKRNRYDEKKINDDLIYHLITNIQLYHFDKFVIPGNTQSMFKFSINNVKENVTGQMDL